MPGCLGRADTRHGLGTLSGGSCRYPDTRKGLGSCPSAMEESARPLTAYYRISALSATACRSRGLARRVGCSHDLAREEGVQRAAVQKVVACCHDSN
jgi:hypothetical protein